MYLTKISLQPQSPNIRRALADCQQMHRQVSGLFGVDRKNGEILYRLRTEQGSNTEQGFTMRLHGAPKREVVDFEGIQLIKVED